MANDHDKYLLDLDNYNSMMDEVLRHETIQGMHLGKYLYDALHPRSVIDIGCGPGNYLMPFRHRGCDIYGIDGAGEAGGMLTPEEFGLVDLRLSYVSVDKFDLSLCIEVAEHIPEEYARTLVETICSNSRACYFSAAYRDPAGTPQNGEGHFNLQPKSYWLTLFSEFGWGLNYDGDKAVSDLVKDDSEMDKCGWLRWNGMLLELK